MKPLIPVVNILIRLIAMLLLSFLAACQPSLWQIDNPYSEVEWNEYGRYKANLHTHTSVGGTDSAPDSVVAGYRSLGYSVLTLSDHDTDGPTQTTWPWSDFMSDSVYQGIVAIQGNEISRKHHIGSHFNDYGDSTATSEDTILTEIGKRGGLAIFHHPGRYKKGVTWYADKYRRYDHLIGQEVFNKRNRYPQDRANWDSVLTVLMPERPVWGIASDDMHDPDSDMGNSWVILLLPQLNEKEVKAALAGGTSFFANAPQKVNGPDIPEIQSITVDDDAAAIILETTGYDSVLWISGGHVVHRGDTVDLMELPETTNYIRAEVFRSGNVVLTQPFGLKRRTN